MADFFGSSAPFAEPLWYSRVGNPNYNGSHRRLRDEIRSYVDTEIEPFCSEWEANGTVPQQVLSRHSALGYTALLINPSETREYLGEIKLPGQVSPEEWDGFHDLIAIDEMARCGSLGVLWALGCGNAIGCPPIIHFGTAEQKTRWLPRVIRGDIRFCLGITEPEAGSDVANISTTAERRDGVFMVSGTKRWVTNGLTADYCTAAVRTGGQGKGGISILVIPLHAEGVTRTPIQNSGVASSGCASLVFNNVEVPAANLIGAENEGFKLIMLSFNHERLWITGNCLRLARVCLEDAYQHALSRRTFGRPLIDRQVIRLKIANVGMQIVAAYALLESLVQVRDSNFKRAAQSDEVVGTNIGGLCALAKVNAARATELAVRESQQIMGALGYTRGSGPGSRVERISRDMRVLVIGGGSEEVLLQVPRVVESSAVSDGSSLPSAEHNHDLTPPSAFESGGEEVAEREGPLSLTQDTIGMYMQGPDRLSWAVKQVLQHHDAFRTAFVNGPADTGGPIQFLMESPRVAFETIQVADKAADKAAADQGFTNLEGYHYNLEKGDTLKLRKQLKPGALAKDLSYWADLFKQPPARLPTLNVPEAKADSTPTAWAEHEVLARLNCMVSVRIKDRSRKHKATPMHYYLTSFQILLARLTGSADIVIGVADSNSSTLADQATMGYFASLLQFRLPYDPDKTFHEAFFEAKKQMQGAILHGSVPYGALLDHLGLPPPSPQDVHSHAPLFQAVLDYKQGQAESGNIGDAKIVDSRTPRAGSPYHITLEMSDDPTKAPLITVKLQKEKYGLRDAEVVMDAYLSILSIFSRNSALRVEDGRLNQGAKAGNTKLAEQIRMYIFLLLFP
ncbi:hypothetical protein VTI28DRAFT_4713 [Corynascus sepedonium]